MSRTKTSTAQARYGDLPPVTLDTGPQIVNVAGTEYIFERVPIEDLPAWAARHNLHPRHAFHDIEGDLWPLVLYWPSPDPKGLNLTMRPPLGSESGSDHA